jgi:hypothetical protein
VRTAPHHSRDAKYHHVRNAEASDCKIRHVKKSAAGHRIDGVPGQVQTRDVWHALKRHVGDLGYGAVLQAR